MWSDYKMILKTVLILFFAAFTINETAAQTSENPEGPILEQLIPDFNKFSRVRPFSSENSSAPVIVTVNLFVRSMRIVGYDNDYSVQLTFRQQWRDERLSFSSPDSSKYVSLTNFNEIWQPDIFFSNEIDGKYHELMTRNQYMRIWPDGSVLKSVRISLRLSCPMYFGKFPFDSQTCSLRLASYGFTTRDIILKWKHVDPVQVTSFLRDNIPTLALTQFTADYCNAVTNAGIYACLRIDFSFQRILTSYLVHVYIPSMMMVLTSWVSFWISPKAVTARTLLAILTLFVLTIQTAEVNKTFPQTDYTKAVDIWTGTCLTFVFATLLEFATVHYLSNRKEKNRSSATGSKTDENAKIESNGGQSEEQEISQNDKSPRDGNQWNQGQKEQITQRARRLGGNLISKLESSAHNFDVISRIAFPSLFVLFNIVYWLVYWYQRCALSSATCHTATDTNLELQQPDITHDYMRYTVKIGTN